MIDIVHTAKDMISGMTPVLLPECFVFATVTDKDLANRLLPKARASFHEAEGLSLILPDDLADSSGAQTSPRMRCITLNVYSSLEGVGLTAAVASALAERGIPCNMVAGYHHDHVFVPEDQADTALKVLLGLQG